MRFVAFLPNTPLESAAQVLCRERVERETTRFTDVASWLRVMRIVFTGASGFGCFVPQNGILFCCKKFFPLAIWAALSRGAFSRFHAAYNAIHGHIIYVLIIVVRSFIFHTTVMLSYIFKWCVQLSLHAFCSVFAIYPPWKRSPGAVCELGQFFPIPGIMMRYSVGAISLSIHLVLPTSKLGPICPVLSIRASGPFGVQATYIESICNLSWFEFFFFIP